ncbi:hypothetical protein [Dyadobacter sp. NIV53]|uniref:hypothetical protein n=1 Tax=Dyadobacter sp. NIV53 TaxID=2861765 RepID=UPI001C86F390|nr:hypothetical protein [Dyadobacter sp. NIV53]
MNFHLPGRLFPLLNDVFIYLFFKSFFELPDIIRSWFRKASPIPSTMRTEKITVLNPGLLIGQHPPARPPLFYRVVPLLICASLILFYFIIIITNSVNIPNGDDLYCLLLFTQNFQDTPSWEERFRLITEQWVEHRIVYSRFTALLSYWFTSQVNFVTIIIIGNATLIGFTVLFWKLIRRTGVSMYFLIPVVLILFSPVMYEANVWAGASTVYMPVCFLGLLTIYLLVDKPESGFIPAAMIALLATYSFGNGMFSFIAGLVVLLYLKKYKLSAVWAILAITAILLYFRNFNFYSNTEAFGVSAHFQNPSYLFYNLFGFIGGIFDYAENINSPLMAANIPAILIGIILSAVIFYGIYQFFIKVNTNKSQERLRVIWLGMVAFMGITILVMAYSRTFGEAMNTLCSRYKIYSMVVFILVYWWCLMFYDKKKVVGLVFGGVSLLLLMFNYYANYQKLTNFKSVFLSGLYNYNVNNQWVIYRHTSYFEGASMMLSDSIKHNPDPVYVFNDVFPQLTHQALREADVLGNVRVVQENNCHGRPGKCLSIHTDTYPSTSNVFKGIYLVVYNDENIFLFAANPARNGRFNILTKGEYYKDGFFLDENFGRSLKKGVEYKLAVFCPTEDEKIRRINYKIDG